MMTMASNGSTSPAVPCERSMNHAISEMTVAASNRYTSGSWNCARNFFHLGTGGALANWFGPNFSNRRCASAELRPVLVSTSSALATSFASVKLGSTS